MSRFSNLFQAPLAEPEPVVVAVVESAPEPVVEVSPEPVEKTAKNKTSLK
tara:strand:- start:630 stop:779 length:150 start_codon:yes stop_codon:yes gene_type:complete